MANFKDEKDTFNVLRNIVDVDSVTNDDLKNLQDRLYKMIDYSIKRQDWYEDQKQKVLQIGLAILGSSTAFTAIIAKLIYDKSILGWTAYLGGAFALSVFITGIALIYYYNQSVQVEHPYRKVVDIRSWFYRYNIVGDHTDKLSSNDGKAKEQVKVVVDEFDKYLTRWMEFANEKGRFIKEDLEQVFILQLLQKYRANHLKIMSQILFAGVLFSSFLLLISILSYLLSPKVEAENNRDSIGENNKVNSSFNSDISNYSDSLNSPKINSSTSAYPDSQIAIPVKVDTNKVKIEEMQTMNTEAKKNENNRSKKTKY